MELVQETNCRAMLDELSTLSDYIRAMRTHYKLADEAEDYGEFLRTLEEKYDFRLDNCCWMSATNLKERSYL